MPQNPFLKEFICFVMTKKSRWSFTIHFPSQVNIGSIYASLIFCIFAGASSNAFQTSNSLSFTAFMRKPVTVFLHLANLLQLVRFCLNFDTCDIFLAQGRGFRSIFCFYRFWLTTTDRHPLPLIHPLICNTLRPTSDFQKSALYWTITIEFFTQVSRFLLMLPSC